LKVIQAVVCIGGLNPHRSSCEQHRTDIGISAAANGRSISKNKYMFANKIISGVGLHTYSSLVCVCSIVNARFESTKLLLIFVLDVLLLYYHLGMMLGTNGSLALVEVLHIACAATFILYAADASRHAGRQCALQLLMSLGVERRTVEGSVQRIHSRSMSGPEFGSTL